MAPIAGWNTQLYLTSVPSVSFTNDSLTMGSDSQTFTDATSAHQCWDSSATTTVQAQYDEVQTVTVTGSPTGGTFTLTFGGQTTSALAYNATASQVQTALQALSSIGSGNMLVTGGPGPGTPYTCEFTGSMAKTTEALMTANGSGLTGGTSPGVSVTRWIGGATWATITTGFIIQYPVGRVFFLALQAPGTQVRVSGKYFPFSFLAYARLAQPGLKAGTVDVTSFQNPPSPWKQFLGGLNGGNIKISLLWIDGTFLNHMSNGDLLIIQIYPGQNANQRFQGYGVLNSDAIQSDVTKVNTEDIDFTVNGQLFFIPS